MGAVGKRGTMRAGRRFEAIKPEPSAIWALKPDHAAVVEGRTIFPSRVVRADNSPRVFVSGFNSRKIGSHVIKGAWKGMPIFTLTLEERATCPRSCSHWRDCYGNSMNWARRHSPGPELEMAIFDELDGLQSKYRAGFVVRLHVLGDFYSAEYVNHWQMLMRLYPALHVFGYTAHSKHSVIGGLVSSLNYKFPSRWAVRFSGNKGFMGAVTVSQNPNGAWEGGALVCPAATGKTACCGSCGLCWSDKMRNTAIAFIMHGPKKRTPGKERQ